MTTQTIQKFFVPILGIIAVAAALLWGVDYLRYRQSPEYQVESDLKRIERMYAEDPYGGETPEETLRLFIDALKQGDTDLAAKYFVLDKQEEWKIELSMIKDKGLLGVMVKDLEREKEKKPLYEGNTESYNFFIYNDEGVLAASINIVKGPNKRWKIIDI